VEVVMKDFGIIPAAWSPRLLSLVRIVAAFVWLTHGTQKLFAFPGDGSGHTVAIASIFGAAGIIETICGPLLILGLFTRPVAFLASGEMAAAYFIIHASNSFWPILNHGEVPVLLSFLFLYIAAAGPGPWSLDARLNRGA
jgi:putative oxidoreductase